jgi:small subunit ribosomal protein S21
MIIIDVKKEKSLDSALKKLKYKFSKSKTREELFERQEFTKKSVSRREQIRKARYKEQVRSQIEKNS